MLLWPLLYLTLAPIGVGWLFIRWLLANNRGPKHPKRTYIIAGCLGLVATPIAYILEAKLLNQKLLTDPTGLTVGQLLLNTALIGIIEEGAKSLPLAVFLYRKNYFNVVTDGVIYFCISGMIFGVIEDLSYTANLGLSAGIAKVLVGPFSHAAFASLFGWTIARRKVLRSPAWTIGLGFIGAAGLHALYDFGLFYDRWWSVAGSLFISVLINVGVFVLFRRAQQSDRRIGLAAERVNNFCHSCGWPNPDHLLFCTHCGQRT
jgi:RsiW-degrading membrane proteinase PrsW (M82 family)